MFNKESLTSAFLSFLITFLTSMLTLLSQEGLVTVGDINQVALLSAFLGAVLAGVQGIASRNAKPSDKVKVK